MIKNISKMNYFVILAVIACILSVAIPSLARYKNRLPIDISTVWNGEVATSYRKGNGTQTDPYIIASGAELAYFAQMLQSNVEEFDGYANTYFRLENDIILNNGIFTFDEKGIQYNLSQSTFYIKEYTNEFYDNETYEGAKIGSINSFTSLNNFKGFFDGGSHTIYGLYITDSEKEELALFTNLQGTVQNLYVENAMIYGGGITAGIASTASNSILKNILYKGYTIGNIEGKTTYLELPLEDKIISLENETKEELISLELPNIKGNIKNVTLTGTCTTTNETTQIIINENQIENCNGDFELNLGTTLTQNITISITSIEISEVQLTNLKYKIEYISGFASGIVGYANNISLENVINKSYVYGKDISAGLVAFTNNTLKINQSYNLGPIESANIASGILGSVQNNNQTIEIYKTYNNGIINANLVGGIIGTLINNEGNVILENVFNATNEYSIYSINNTPVTVTNVYQTGEYATKEGTFMGTIGKTTTDQLKDKTNMTTNLFYEEFIDFENLNANPTQVWVYEDNNYPILYIDDMLNSIASIHVSTYSWNTLGYELDTLNFSTSLVFSIEQENDLNPLKEIYYYLSNEKNALTKAEIEAIENWTLYENIVEIKDEGFYTIYAKIVDTNDKITYLNTDLLVLDLSNPTTTISLNNQTWNDFRTIENYIYINKVENLTIDALDELSGIRKIEYYLSNSIIEDKENFTSWIEYKEKIPIPSKGTYILYAKVTDNSNHVTYANTDYIIFGGYEEVSVQLGRKDVINTYPVSITNKSSIAFNLTYSDTNGYEEGYTHQIVSNILFPIHTKITLQDNITGKKYVYQIDSEEDLYSYNNSCEENDTTCVKTAKYPFTIFKEIGKGTMDSLFIESTDGEINENFTILIDFTNTSISNNYENVELYVTLQDKNGTIVRSTLRDTIKPYNIYINQNATPYIINKYTGSTIVYNSDNTYTIPLEVGLQYKTLNNSIIYDTTYQDKTLGLALKLVDDNNAIVEKKYLKNIRFQVGENTYSPDNDGIVRINLENDLNTFNGNVLVITQNGGSKLPAGTYYLKIYSFASYDGIYTNTLSESVATIPVTANEIKEKPNYSFDVLMDETKKIISKEEENVELNFDILQTGNFSNPTIRVSLYNKKDKTTAYDQEYTKIDLQDYVSDTLEKIEENSYYAFKSPIFYQGTIETYNHFSLNILPSYFENNGYKLVFELYDGTEKIGTIEKKFIVK